MVAPFDFSFSRGFDAILGIISADHLGGRAQSRRRRHTMIRLKPVWVTAAAPHSELGRPSKYAVRYRGKSTLFTAPSLFVARNSQSSPFFSQYAPSLGRIDPSDPLGADVDVMSKRDRCDPRRQGGRHSIECVSKTRTAVANCVKCDSLTKRMASDASG